MHFLGNIHLLLQRVEAKDKILDFNISHKKVFLKQKLIS